MSGGAAQAAMGGAVTMRVERSPAPLRGRVRVPGSKSVSTRAAVLAALSPEPVLLRDVLVADDMERLLAALEAMGVSTARLLGSDRRIDGREWRSRSDEVAVDLGDGGAPTRFAMALAALRSGATVIDGSARMRERPVGDGVTLLRELGVRIEALGEAGRLPLRVQGAFGTFAGTGGAGGPALATSGAAGGRGGAAAAAAQPPEIAIGRTASSQFVTALLLIAPALPAGLRVRFTDVPTSASYLSLTIDVLRAFGATAEVEPDTGASRDPAAGSVITVRPGLARPRVDAAPPSFPIPADASSAVVWAAAAAMIPGSRIELEGVVRDAQPDVRAIEAIGRMGASLEWRGDALVVSHAPLRGIDANAEAWPDGALAVAAAATAAEGPTRLRSLGTLRVKESDRLAALSGEFGRLGIDIRVEGDDLVIEPPPRAVDDGGAARDPAVEVAAHRDHRIAMSLALVGLRRGGVAVRGAECVAKSYPDFWRHLGRLAPAAATVT